MDRPITNWEQFGAAAMRVNAHIWDAIRGDPAAIADRPRWNAASRRLSECWTREQLAHETTVHSHEELLAVLDQLDQEGQP